MINKGCTDIWSPDEFMFKQFYRHMSIFTSSKRRDFFVLSSGINLFPMPRMWKELYKLEIDMDFAYQWYTAEEGFPSLQHAAKFWENFAASQGEIYTPVLSGRICMTMGGSQAAAAVFDYLSASCPNSTILLVGLNYPLFERLAKPYKMNVLEIPGSDTDEGYSIPTVDQVIETLRRTKPQMVIITVPNNPSGQSYVEEELVEIFLAARESGTLVLVDQACQMQISRKRWVNVGKAVLMANSQSNVIVINSFSKTESVPGLRIGYIMGSQKVVSHVVKYQLNSILNPPTVPILPLFFSFLVRCIFAGENMNWISKEDWPYILKFFMRSFEISTAIAPEAILEEVLKRLSFGRFEKDYRHYIEEQLEKEDIMDRNYAYILETLGSYIKKHTIPQNGFNFLVELEPFSGKDEDGICKELFNSTGVAILTESCFRVCPKKDKKNFWVRISTAAPEEQFRPAVDKLRHFLKNLR